MYKGSEFWVVILDDEFIFFEFNGCMLAWNWNVVDSYILVIGSA